MAKMILVQVPRDVGPIQVEFPEHVVDVKGRKMTEGKGDDKKPIVLTRSGEGAMHLRPGSTKLMTMAELNHIRTVLPEGRRLQAVKETDPEAKAKEAKVAKKAAEAAEAATGAPAIAAVAASEPVPEASGSKKSSKKS